MKDAYDKSVVLIADISITKVNMLWFSKKLGGKQTEIYRLRLRGQ